MFRSLAALLFLVASAHLASAGGADYLAAGKAAREAGKPNAAVEAFTQAIKAGDLSQDDLASAYRLRGGAWGFLGENTKGIADFTAALKLDPNMGAALTLRGYLYGVIGNYAAAEKDQKAALALAPTMNWDTYKPWVLQHTADLWRRRGNTAKALSLCDEAQALAPDLPDIRFRRAWIYLDADRKSDAKAEFAAFKLLNAGQDLGSYWPDERGAIARLAELN